MEAYDLLVIGAGPGGYVAAIRGAQLGMKTACVEKNPTLGGVCLNVGCIPSKALLDSSERYHMAATEFESHGIQTGSLSFDLGVMMARKEKVVKDLTQGIGSLFRKNKITALKGTAKLLSASEVEVGGERIQAKRILIATGSEPFPFPGFPFDGKKILSSTEALALTKVPEHLIVIGGGAIGLELGSVWRRLGAKVSVVEMLPHLVGGLLDPQVHRLFLRSLQKQGLDFHLGQKVQRIKPFAKGVKVEVEADGGKCTTLTGDKVLVAIGRKPYTAGLNLEEVGVKLDKRGRIAVGKDYQTTVAGVYAVGDIIAGPMLAHKASEEGVAAVEQMAGLRSDLFYPAVPSVVYTWPEVAWAGQSEVQLKALGVPFKVGAYPFLATPRAKTMGSTEGVVKVFVHGESHHILGACIFGPGASELIAEAVLLMESGGKVGDLAHAVHAHPTLSESMKEAALNAEGMSIHI